MSEEQPKSSRPNPIPGNKPFKKGQSGNPKGRIPMRPWRDDLRKILAEPSSEKRKDRQKKLMEQLVEAAEGGDLKAYDLLMDILPGERAPKQTETEHSGKVTLMELLTDDPDES